MCSLVPILFSFTGSWWSPQASPFSMGKERDAPGWRNGCQHLLEFYQQSCAPGDLTDTNQSWLSPAASAFLPWPTCPLSPVPIPWQAGPLFLLLLEGGRVHHQKPPCAFPFPGYYPEKCFSHVSLATAVLSGHSPKLTMLYLSPVQNQCNSRLHFKLLTSKPILLCFPHYPLSAAVDYN